MENGFVILGIIALLFLGMYMYSYYSVFFEKRKRKMSRENLLKEIEVYRQERLRKQQLRAEKLRHVKERSAEIKMELMRLAKMKQERLSKSGDQPSHQVA